MQQTASLEAAQAVSPSSVSFTIRPAETTPYRYASEIQSMLYTFGDAKHPLLVTAHLIEDLVHGELVDLILQAVALTASNGLAFFYPCYDASVDAKPMPPPRSIPVSVDELLFSIRHDHVHEHRVREFLAWKEVRRTTTAKDTADITAIEDDTEQLLPSSAKRTVVSLWDPLSGIVPSGELHDAIMIDYHSTHHPTVDPSIQQRLRARLESADRITRNMSTSEYMAWTECRQASFTFKKGRKFREWVATREPLSWLNRRSFVQNVRMSDEVVEVLGFLAYEMVGTLVEGTLKTRNTKATTKSAKVKVGFDRQAEIIEGINAVRKLSPLAVPLTREEAGSKEKVLQWPPLQPEEVQSFYDTHIKRPASLVPPFKAFSHPILGD